MSATSEAISHKVYIEWCNSRNMPIEMGFQLAVEAGMRAATPQRLALPVVSGFTRRQAELLRYLTDFMERHEGIAPSFQEMMEALGLHSKSGVARIISSLEERGAIVRRPNRARAIEILARLPDKAIDYPHVKAA